ncbi:alpha-adducin-like isoform X3 [Liolophura sinensis]|uniref:alpha-adducin-like isoform X3 n=1 Tax=Liolophura sinensis TaxID=3198878 RepID=UPI00315846EF
MTDSAPQMNGPASPSGKYIDSIDPDDPEYQRSMRRPADVKEDVQQMEQRKRVSLVLNSQAFREELEHVVEDHLKSGQNPASLLALQQITDLLLPHMSVNKGVISRGSTPVIPINDIRGVDSLNYSKVEKLIRCKLAALYRLVDIFGWTHGIYNHITARINQEQEHFLINPFGVLYGEVTAGSLVKVDMQGEILDLGTTALGVNKAGFTLHSAIHQARPDIKCIIHLHTPAAVAVSVMKCGLLPISQEALICGGISYHDYNGILVDNDEKEILTRNLGPVNKVLFLRNHGIVVCGSTIDEAFHYAFNVMAACETQIRAIPAGIDNLVQVSDEPRRQAFLVGSQGGGGVDMGSGGRKWRVGELEFEALMRLLDNAGYRTGHVYHQPIIKREKKERSNSDVEIPPSSSSFTYVFDGDYESSKYRSPLKAALERQKQQYKAGWLNSPNTYAKQEIDETGTTNPKKITRWVPEGSPTNAGRAVKIENPNQFAPQGDNPKEFRQKQKQIKKDYYEEKVSAGPQSKILEGVTWDEAQKMKDGNLSGTADQVIVFGAASKGIIQRDHQHNAVVYKSQYTANPFENVTEDELETYKRQVEGKGTGDNDLSPGPDGKLISSDERIQQIQQSRDGGGDARKSDGETSPVFVESSVDTEVPNGAMPESPRRREPEEGRQEEPARQAPVQRSESARHPERSRDLIDELQQRGVDRSQSERRRRSGGEVEGKPGSPTKSTDSASGGDTLDESREGSPTKDMPSSPTKEKKKKKKFRMPSFSKKKKEKE